MRRTLAAASATLAAIALTISLGHLDAAAATPQSSQAHAALRYLYSQQQPDGSIAESPGATEDTIIGTADNGFDPATLRTAAGVSAFDYLKAQVLSPKGTAANTAGHTAKLILALVAAHQNPHDFARVDLVGRLNGAPAVGGYRQPNGAFHASDPKVEVATTFSQAFAVLADVAAGRTLPPNAVEWLVCAQRNGVGEDHGFGSSITDASASPPASCGDSSTGSNFTAIALQALDAAQHSSANDAAASYLASVQNVDAGFTFFNPGDSDPDSDAIVIEALVAAGRNPSAFANASRDVLANLTSFQDKANGGFIFSRAYDPNPDAFTTSQVPAALALKPYSAATNFATGSSPNDTARPALTGSTPPTSGPPLGATIAVPPTGGHLPVPAAAGLLLGGLGVLSFVGRRSRRPRRTG